MQTLQSVKYNRIKAILTSVGIEANDKDILMLVAEIDVAPQFICAAHIIPALFKNKDREHKEVQHELLNHKEYILGINDKRNVLEHNYNNLVKHCDSVKEKLEQERRTTTTQSMRITLIEDYLYKINKILNK